MVLRTYTCVACGTIVEHREQIDSDIERLCPVCSKKMERKITKSTVIFKGSRWAKDNYSDGG
jgi:putative FmdB family regulatory protein